MKAENFGINEVVMLGGVERAVVITLHPKENMVTVQQGNRRTKVPATKLVKQRRGCCGGSKR